MSRVIKSRNVDFKPDAIRLPIIVPVIYKEPGAGDAAGLDSRVRAVEALVHDAEKKACSIVEKAEEAAREIAEKARVEGFEAGRREGYAEGQAQAEAEAAATRAEASRVLEEARETARRTLAEAEPRIMEIALAVARKVIKREVSADPEIVLANIREALKNVDREEAVTVRTSPVEVAVVDNARKKLKKQFGGVGDIAVQEDPSVEPGGCVVSTDKGIVDARIESQVEAIRERLSEVFECRDRDRETPEGN